MVSMERTVGHIKKKKSRQLRIDARPNDGSNTVLPSSLSGRNAGERDRGALQLAQKRFGPNPRALFGNHPQAPRPTCALGQIFFFAGILWLERHRSTKSVALGTAVVCLLLSDKKEQWSLARRVHNAFESRRICCRQLISCSTYNGPRWRDRNF